MCAKRKIEKQTLSYSRAAPQERARLSFVCVVPHESIAQNPVYADSNSDLKRALYSKLVHKWSELAAITHNSGRLLQRAARVVVKLGKANEMHSTKSARNVERPFTAPY